MNKVELVIPVGPGDPALDVPKEDLLEAGLLCAKRQTMPITLTCAVDKNLPEKKLELIKKHADKVVMFDNHSYYRRGGIWNKIFTCWEQSDADYVAWNGYDDSFSADRFAHQSRKLDETNANSCFCHNFHSSNGRKVFVNNGNIHWESYLGRHAPYMGAFLLRRTAILNSGIAEYRMKWAAYFEGLLYAFIFKTGRPVVSQGQFYYHDHPGTISNTVREERQWVKDARTEAEYSLAETMQDWDSIGFQKLCDEIKGNV